MMKEGWEYRKLGDVCDIIGGGTPSKKNALYYNGTIPWASVRDMNCDILSSTEYSITEEGLNDSASHIIEKGEIIIATRVGLGKVCVLAQSTAINQDLKGIIPKKENINRNFLFYYFKSRAKVIEENGVGATVKGVRLKFVETLQIPIPPLPEQHRIVEYLNTQFAKIDALKTNAEQQLQAAKDLFQSALKDLMTPKEGWEEKKLKDIGKTQTGCTPSKSNVSFYGDYMPFIRPAELNIDGIGGISYDSEIKLSKLGVQQCRLIRKDSILMCCIGSVGKTAYTTRDITCNQQINAITPYEEFNPRFVYYVLLSPRFQEEAIKIANSARATLAIISKGKWENIIVAIPTLYNQQYIANQLDSLSANIKSLQSNYEQTLTLCNDLKQSLLKKIFE